MPLEDSPVRDQLVDLGLCRSRHREGLQVGAGQMGHMMHPELRLNKHVDFGSPASQFTYTNNVFLPSFLPSCLYTPKGEFSPMAKYRSKEEPTGVGRTGVRGRTCLNLKACCLIHLRPRASGDQIVIVTMTMTVLAAICQVPPMCSFRT